MKTPLTFCIFTIICLIPFTGFSQFISLTGKITSEKDGKILENADVLECSSKTGTISDKDGFYKLILTPGNIDLLVSNEGFADYSQKLFLKSDTTISVILKPAGHFKIKNREEKVLQTNKTTNKEEIRKEALK